jgi:hypothetical protein
MQNDETQPPETPQPEATPREEVTGAETTVLPAGQEPQESLDGGEGGAE